MAGRQRVIDEDQKLELLQRMEAGGHYEDPRLGAGEGRLEVLGEPTASSEPGESSLDDASSQQHLEAFGRVGAPDDFDGPRAGRPGPGSVFSGIAAVGE